MIVEVGLKEALEEGTLQEFHEVVTMIHDTEGRKMEVVDKTENFVGGSGSVSHPKAFESPDEVDELTWEGVRIDLSSLDSEVEALSVLLFSSAPLGDDDQLSELDSIRDRPQTLYCKVLDNSGGASVPYEAKSVLAEFTKELEVGPTGSVVLTLNRVNWPALQEAAANAMVIPTVGIAAGSESGSNASLGERGGTTSSGDILGVNTGAGATLGGSVSMNISPENSGTGSSATRHASTPHMGAGVAIGAGEDRGGEDDEYAGIESMEEAAAKAAKAFAGEPVEASWQVKFVAHAVEHEDVVYDELLGIAEDLMVAKVENQPVRSIQLKPKHSVVLPKNPETFALEFAWAMKDPEAYPLFPKEEDKEEGEEGQGEGGEGGDEYDHLDDDGYSDSRSGGGKDNGYDDDDDAYDGYDDDEYDDDSSAGAARAARRKAKVVAAAEAELAKSIQVVAVTTDARGKPLELIPTTVGVSGDGSVAHKPSRRNAAGEFISTVALDLAQVDRSVAGVSFLLVDLNDKLSGIGSSRVRVLDSTGVDVDAALAPPEPEEDEDDMDDSLSDDGSGRGGTGSRNSSGSSPSSRQSRRSRQSSHRSRDSSTSRPSESSSQRTGKSSGRSSSQGMNSRSMSERMRPSSRNTSSSTLLSAAKTKGTASVAVINHDGFRADEAQAQAQAQEMKEPTLPPEPELGPELAAFKVAALDVVEDQVVGIARPPTPVLAGRGGSSGSEPAVDGAVDGAGDEQMSATEVEGLLASAQVLCRVQRVTKDKSGRGASGGRGGSYDDGRSPLPSVSDDGYDDGPGSRNEWEILPLGNYIPGTNLVEVEQGLERSIHEIIPRFTVDLKHNEALRLKDYKEGWDYTNLVFGFGWDGEAMDRYEEFPFHAGCMMLDERGTELATIGLARPSSVDGAVVHMVTEELRLREAQLKREANAASDAAAAAAARAAGEDPEEYDEYDEGRGSDSRSGTAYSGGSAMSDGGDADGPLANDMDMEKIAIDLPKLSDKVAALVLVLGMHMEEELTPELDVYLRILDQTKTPESGEAWALGSGFEAARYSLYTEEGHTSLVVALVQKSKETGKWSITPVEQYYEGYDFADVLVDIENNYRQSVTEPKLEIPDTVATSLPRQLLDLDAHNALPVGHTLALVKPRAAAAKLAPSIKEFILLHGFSILRSVRTTLTRPQAEMFYAVHASQPWYEALIEYMTSGPIEAYVLGRRGAVPAWRACVDALRSKYALDATRNAVHGSDSASNARKEIKLFFPDMAIRVPSPEEGARFLEAAVTPVLLKGLTALSKAKPEEPMVWLAHWLLANNPNKPKCVVELA